LTAAPRDALRALAVWFLIEQKVMASVLVTERSAVFAEKGVPS